MPDEKIVDGGPLMDPQSQQFQDMLASARAKGEQSLSVNPDTSATESQTDVAAKAEPGSSPEGKADEDVETDDIEKLKNTIRGLKSEMTRVRNQRSASEDEASSLKERLAKMEGRLDEIREQAPNKSAQASVKKLSEEKLIELHTAYQDELADARAIARQAERDGDREAITQANQRIDNARKMMTMLATEQNERIKQASRQAREAEDETSRLGTELENLFADVFKAAPELADQNSALWKAGQEEYRKLPMLTKKLGPLGELIATAAAISKNPSLIGAKSEKKLAAVLENIEQVADKSFNKGGAAPQRAVPKDYNLNSQTDVLNFEELVKSVKMSG